ncbi:MAG: phosphotransferase [Pseudomonadales bacterium]|nr:phosphotransferase [Pseudomonadales bacterium]
MTDTAALPASPDELTPAWLTDALTRGGTLSTGARVIDCTPRPLGAGGGLMALVARIELEYAGQASGAPRTLIAKFPSPVADNRAVAETYDMYGREVRFYQTLAALTPLPHPSCHFAAQAADGSGFVLLLEDLGDRRPGDQVAGSGLAEAEVVIDALAAFHARHFGGGPGRLADWVTSHANAAQIAGMTGGFEFGWPRFVEMFGDTIPPGVRRWGERVGPATGAILGAMCSGPQVLTHGDCRLENMFFATRPDQPPFAIVDWQSITWSSPGQDLAYYLTQSVQLEVRRRHERDLLARYLDGLRRHGVRDYPADRLSEDYRRAALYLLDYAVVIAATLDLSNARGAAIARALATRACAALEDLDCGRLLPG